MDIFEAEMARRFVVAIEKIANALDRKDEPTISKMEQVDWKDQMWAEAVEDEPQTDNPCDNCQEWTCDWCAYAQTERSE